VRIAVAGLGHQGSVAAAGLASVGHDVAGFDPDPGRVERLRRGQPPLQEPGLGELIVERVAAGRLRFSSDAGQAFAGAQAVWFAEDTPLDEQDRGDAAEVRARIDALAPRLEPGSLLLLSSQVPVGFTRALEQAWPRRRIAYVAENLRLGRALETFLRPAQVVAGVRRAADRAAFAPLFASLGWSVEWLSVESAEMAKHALNAFLATSAAFANELARLCEAEGADAKQVERALRGDARVGSQAYLAPGAPVSGGTLARDLRYLAELARRDGVAAPLAEGVLASNGAHEAWLFETVTRRLRGRDRPVAAVLGLTYKQGTGALRRSASLGLCARLAGDGVGLRVHDPSVKARPEGLAPQAVLCASAREALSGADVAVIATAWPEFRALTPEDFVGAMRAAQVVDPAWLLADRLAADARIDYAAAGSVSAVPGR
jgi:UDPglucose 6-dehydrogenase